MKIDELFKEEMKDPEFSRGYKEAAKELDEEVANYKALEKANKK